MKIEFGREARDRYFQLLEKVFASNFLSEGECVKEFERRFGSWVNLQAVAVTNGGAALHTLFEFAEVRGKEVIVPTNTFMATPLAVIRAGGKPVFADVNRYDLCLSASDLEKRFTSQTRAVVVVHIGGHLAFDIEKIAEICRDRGVLLIEDCAHAQGAHLRNRCGGTFGIGGAYSFYATKTLPLGEGGMVVSARPEVIEFARGFRNYGKPDYKVNGLNYRMNEVTAALGIVQMERVQKIVEWKRSLARRYDRLFPNHLVLPDGMASGYYKYIGFDARLKMQTGKVYDELCHTIMGFPGRFPDAEWIARHHVCPPIYYGWEGADWSDEELISRVMDF